MTLEIEAMAAATVVKKLTMLDDFLRGYIVEDSWRSYCFSC